jgi:hypothetical protein
MSETRAEYIVAGRDVVVPELADIAVPVLRALRDCESMPVPGMAEMVAVRVPKALWALIRGEEGE